MLNFEFTSYIRELEQAIAKSLNNTGKPDSNFSWYLSLHLEQAIADTQHRDFTSKNVPVDNLSSYLSIEYQRTEFYSQAAHYKQHITQHTHVQNSADPSLYLAWINAVQPQSLTGHRQAKNISDDVIENMPFVAQSRHKYDANSILSNAQSDYDDGLQATPLNNNSQHESHDDSWFVANGDAKAPDAQTPDARAGRQNMSLNDELPTNQDVDFLFAISESAANQK